MRAKVRPQPYNGHAMFNVNLTGRKSEVLLRVAKGDTLLEIGMQ